ncbi:MAG: peptidoglycan DD-metalloendopeptidase family protein [Solirubrobacterales bacterium]
MSDNSLDIRSLAGWTLATALLICSICAVFMASTAAAADPLPNRPNFLLPFDCGTTDLIQTYAGHNPDDKKMDMYVQGQPTNANIRASAPGLVHEEFYPGGIEINHGNGWFTTYMHMKWHVPAGTYVQQGQIVGTMGDIGGNGVVHLHYEQLYAPGRSDAQTSDMVNPILQGEGPIVMQVGKPLYRVSQNCGGGGTPGPSAYTVDTYAAAPGYDKPGGTRTGTLNAGTNYVYCRRIGPKVTQGSSYNSWWLKTDLDTGPAGQWVSAIYLSRWGNDEAKDNSGNTIPLCDQPYGTIGAKWNAIGGGASVLGWPTLPEMDAKKGGRFQQFQNGIILWKPNVAQVIRGAILDRFWASGGEEKLGFATMDEAAAATAPNGTKGQYQYFDDGVILWSAATGAHWVHGAIEQKFASSGREAALGYPTGEEVAEGTNGRKQAFQKSTIHWNPTQGAWITTP